MKIKMFKSDLVKNMQKVQNVISSKSSLPILSNVLIEAEQGNIRLTSTDLDIGISAIFPSEAEEEGAITVPAKRFSDIVKELPDEDILINTMKNNSMSIKCGKCFFKILGLPKEDFPKLPEFKTEPDVIMEQAVLKNMLSMTYFSMSHDETRYVLNGALFLFKANQLTIVTTDGKRLSLLRKELPNTVTDRSVIVPSKTIYELNRVLEDEGEVRITLSENQIRFEAQNITIISRLIEGEFPNYSQVIPKEAKEKIVLNREQFLLGVKRAALLTTQDSRAIKIDVLKNKMVISKSHPNIGEAKEEIDTAYNGHEISVGFNPGYLMDVLKVAPRDELAVEIVGPDKPVVIRIGDGCLYLLLPMQLT
ncbi:MAG: DNA polymerase III subunit beta [Candidatus Omnitrophica bacterium]|nr:DNA polymerase III subunit beta [Candidatus Omnitrophota bacterium]MBU4457290.1 DNA polymerase III subunit beta [Candidatus Omnitrophota bacterium]